MLFNHFLLVKTRLPRKFRAKKISAANNHTFGDAAALDEWIAFITLSLGSPQRDQPRPRVSCGRDCGCCKHWH